MIARLYANHFFFIAMVLASFYTCTAEAATRAILIPGKSAILLMEGFSSAGVDHDPRRLYEAIALPPVHQQGGDGKIISTDGKEFNLTCATKNSQADSIVCNITVNASAGAKIEFQQAEYHATGATAKFLNDKLAGASGVGFKFETSDHGLKIESTAEQFDFFFHY